MGCSKGKTLELFIFLLGVVQVFRKFNVRVRGVFGVIGLGSWVPALFFCVLPTPSSQCWARVWVIGPLNRGTGL